MPNFPPSAFIVGSQKCGTSSLAKLLGDNPGICLSNPKEPNYYTSNYQKGLHWYKNCFRDSDKILLDASTTYSMCPLSAKASILKEGRERQKGVPGRIFADSPDARIIYIIRDPVSRLYSNYWHNVKYGYEKLPLNKAVERDPQYIHVGEYFGQIAKYLAHFSKQQILILRFEDFLCDQQKIVNLCAEFIEVPVSTTNAMARENVSKQYTGVGQLIINNRFAKHLDKIVPKAAKHALKKLISKEIAPLASEAVLELRAQFLEDQKQLLSEFGISYLGDWKAL